jgi:hypothetical protein
MPEINDDDGAAFFAEHERKGANGHDKRWRSLVQSSGKFMESFVQLDYVIDGILRET